MLQCHSCRQSLTAYLENTLDSSTRADVATHLESCPDCAKELRREVAIRETLRDFTPQAAPVDLRSRVRAAVEAEQTRRTTFSWAGIFGPLAMRGQGFAWAGGASAAAFALLLLVRSNPEVVNTPTLTADAEVPAVVAQAPAQRSVREHIVKSTAKTAPASRPAANKPGTTRARVANREKVASAESRVEFADAARSAESRERQKLPRTEAAGDFSRIVGRDQAPPVVVKVQPPARIALKAPARAINKNVPRNLAAVAVAKGAAPKLAAGPTPAIAELSAPPSITAPPPSAVAETQPDTAPATVMVASAAWDTPGGNPPSVRERIIARVQRSQGAGAAASSPAAGAAESTGNTADMAPTRAESTHDTMRVASASAVAQAPARQLRIAFNPTEDVASARLRLQIAADKDNGIPAFETILWSGAAVKGTPIIAFWTPSNQNAVPQSLSITLEQTGAADQVRSIQTQIVGIPPVPSTP